MARLSRLVTTQHIAVQNLLEQKLEDKIVDIRQEVTSMKKLLSELENRVNELMKRVEEQLREVKMLESKVETETVEKRLSELSSEVREVAYKQREQDYAALVKTLSEIRAQLTQVLECLRQYALTIAKSAERR